MLVMEKPTVSDEIDRLVELKNSLEAYLDKAKEVRAVFDQRSAALLTRIEEEGLTTVSSPKGRVAIDESVVPQVENWDDFYSFIHRHKAYHLLERRPATAAYRELIAQRGKKPVPGVVPYTKRSLKLTRT